MAIECEHKGAKRYTCCGTPDMWICRFHKADCVDAEYEKTKLIAAVNNKEARALKVCESCADHKHPKP